MIGTALGFVGLLEETPASAALAVVVLAMLWTDPSPQPLCPTTDGTDEVSPTDGVLNEPFGA